MKSREKNLWVFQVYVNDIIFGATKNTLREDFSKLIGSESEMSLMGELRFFVRL